LKRRRGSSIAQVNRATGRRARPVEETPMPSLLQIALRYGLWMLGLNVIHQVAVNILALPPTQTVPIMLAAIPALVVANYMTSTATRALVLSDWAVAWSIIFAIYLVVNLLVPAVFSEAVRSGLANPDVLRQIGTILIAVALLQALFLFIGQLLAR